MKSLNHYIYLHKTKNGIPFYIGIGTKQFGDKGSFKKIYARAFSLAGRTSFWHKIVKKHGISIEILVESSDYEFIKEQEIYFISKYGRRDLKKGTLCNLTDGGDGCLGHVLSEESKKKLSKRQKENFANGKSYLLSDKHKSYLCNLSSKMKGNQYAKGRKLSDEAKENLYKNRLQKLSRRVIQEDISGNFIKEWYTTVEVANHFGITYKAVWKACNNYYKGAKCKGFRWRFKE